MPLRVWAEPIPRSKIWLDLSSLRREARGQKNKILKIGEMSEDIFNLLSKVHSQMKKIGKGSV